MLLDSFFCIWNFPTYNYRKIRIFEISTSIIPMFVFLIILLFFQHGLCLDLTAFLSFLCENKLYHPSYKPGSTIHSNIWFVSDLNLRPLWCINNFTTGPTFFLKFKSILTLGQEIITALCKVNYNTRLQKIENYLSLEFFSLQN